METVLGSLSAPQILAQTCTYPKGTSQVFGGTRVCTQAAWLKSPCL